MNVITDTKQIHLSPSGATLKKNGFLNSRLQFNIPFFIKKDKNVMYHTIKVLHAEIPYSFYIINEYNSKLVLTTGTITFPYGNYNANTFMQMLQPLLPVNMTITFDTFTGIFTLTYNLTFSILSSSTCGKLMGFQSGTSYTSVSNKITMLYPANFLGTKNLYIKIPSLIIENYNTNTKDYSTLLALPIGVSPFGIINYDNVSASKNVIKNTNGTDLLDVVIVDDDNNDVDFNNIDWNITLEVETIIQLQQTYQNTVQDFLNEIYSKNISQNNS
jgi:hypothetical protein